MKMTTAEAVRTLCNHILRVIEVAENLTTEVATLTSELKALSERVDLLEYHTRAMMRHGQDIDERVKRVEQTASDLVLGVNPLQQ